MKPDEPPYKLLIYIIKLQFMRSGAKLLSRLATLIACPIGHHPPPRARKTETLFCCVFARFSANWSCA